MKRRTMITVSIVSIVIISLMLLGLTYGYFVTKINGNTNEKSVEVATGNMSVLYTDLSKEVDALIQPGFETVKAFTIENIGNVSATYSIFLVEVVNNFNRIEDITYILYRLNGQYEGEIDVDTDFSDWDTITTGTYPTSATAIKANEVINAKSDTDTSNPIYTYALKITYINADVNQNEDQGKTFSGKINIRGSESDINPFSEGTLAYNIINNGALVEKSKVGDRSEVILTGEKIYDKTIDTITTFTGVSNGTDINDCGIFSAEDDYGTSYYYRGTVRNNYVSFAGFTWRIVRINGDGSIRLILDGTLDKVSECNDTTICALSPFNLTYNDNAYIGYMYGLSETTTGGERCLILENEVVTDKVTETGYTTKTECENKGGKWTTTAYEATHANVGSSIIKKQLDLFYETYIENEINNYHYGDFLSDTMFCADKTLASNGIGNVAEQLGYGKLNATYYAASERLQYSSGTLEIVEANPTLKCAQNATNDYSRYTVEKTNVNNVKTNGDLTYPIALLSADELVMAGAFDWLDNKYYYLNTAYLNGHGAQNWWTMTPDNYAGGSYMFYGIGNEVNSIDFTMIIYSDGVRPVINLKSNVLVTGGNGTSESKYTVSLPG